MKAVLLFVLCFFLSAPVAYGMIIGPVKVEGTVVKYDKKTVTLRNNKGNKIKVSRRSVPKKFKLKTGAKVQALLKPEVITRRLQAKNKKALSQKIP